MLESYLFFGPYVIFFTDGVLIDKLRHTSDLVTLKDYLFFSCENNAKCQYHSTVHLA